MEPEGRLNKKDGLTRYGNSHVKDKTVSPTVLSLTWESPYLAKTVFILRRGPVCKHSKVVLMTEDYNEKQTYVKVLGCI